MGTHFDQTAFSEGICLQVASKSGGYPNRQKSISHRNPFWEFPKPFQFTPVNTVFKTGFYKKKTHELCRNG